MVVLIAMMECHRYRGATTGSDKILETSLLGHCRWKVAVGIVTGRQNPGVKRHVELGLGYG